MTKKTIDRKRFIKFVGGATVLGIFWPRRDRLGLAKGVQEDATAEQPHLPVQKAFRSVARKDVESSVKNLA